MSISHWVRDNSDLHSDENCDILIVGGGYVGLSTAFWLSKYRPDLKIIVLEKKSCGAGASGRNAGFLTKGSASFFKSLKQKWGKEKALEIYQFAQESLDLVQTEILPHISFEETTSFTLFQTQEQHEKWSSPDFNPLDFHFRWIDKNKLPENLKEKFVGAYESSREFKVNPLDLVNSLKKILLNKNVKIIENVSAYELTASGVKTEVNHICANQIILALNGYLPQFQSVFHEAITPRRAQMIAVELAEKFEARGLYYDPPERVYWRMLESNILLVGGKRLLDENAEVGEFDKVSSTIQNGLEDYIQHLGFKNYKVINRWSGVMGFTEHELPYISKINSKLPTYVTAGFSGHGIGFGFRAAQETALLTLGKKTSSFFDSFKKLEISL